MVYEEFVAPTISTVPFFHWYDNGAVPDAATEKVTEAPALTVWD